MLILQNGLLTRFMKKYISLGELLIDYRDFNKVSQADLAANLADLDYIQRGHFEIGSFAWQISPQDHDYP